jgi:hypothetical protein
MSDETSNIYVLVFSPGFVLDGIVLRSQIAPRLRHLQETRFIAGIGGF